MHKKILRDADIDQLKHFIDKSLCELKYKDQEMYEELEEELYVEVYGYHFNDWSLEKALSKLQNEDGSSGGHWTLEQTTLVVRNNGIEFEDFNAYDWCYVMNLIYSDYYGSISNDTASYVRMAQKFLNDKDAKEGKAYRYWLAMK